MKINHLLTFLFLLGLLFSYFYLTNKYKLNHNTTTIKIGLSHLSQIISDNFAQVKPQSKEAINIIINNLHSINQTIAYQTIDKDFATILDFLTHKACIKVNQNKLTKTKVVITQIQAQEKPI